MRPQSQARYSLETVAVARKRQDRPVSHGNDQVNWAIARELQDGFDEARGIIGRGGIPESDSTVPGDLSRRVDPSVGTHSYPMPRPTKRPGESECGCTVTIQHQYSCQSLSPKLLYRQSAGKACSMPSKGVRHLQPSQACLIQWVWSPLIPCLSIFADFIAWSGKSRTLILRQNRVLLGCKMSE